MARRVTTRLRRLLTFREIPGRRSRLVLLSKLVDERYEERVDGEAGRAAAGVRVVLGLQDLDG